MLGSLVYAGGMALEDALDIVGIDGAVLGDELERIGWAATPPCPGPPPRLRRAAHRAGPGAGGAGRHDRRGHGRAGHLVAGADPDRPVQPRRHHPDAAAPRRRLRRRRSVATYVRRPAPSWAATRWGRSAASTCTPTWSTWSPPAPRSRSTCATPTTPSWPRPRSGCATTSPAIAEAEGVSGLAAPGPVRPGRLRPGGDRPGRAGRRRPVGPVGHAPAVGRGARRPDAGPGLPHWHGLRPQPRRA